MGVLIDVASRSGLKRTRKERDSSTISERVSSLILSAKMFSPRQHDERQIKNVLGGKLVLTIQPRSDAMKR